MIVKVIAHESVIVVVALSKTRSIALSWVRTKLMLTFKSKQNLSMLYLYKPSLLLFK